MSDLKTYISSLPGLTDEELVTEARSAASLLSRARKSDTKRAVANLEKMRAAIHAEKLSRKGAEKNPGESTVSSYAGKVARMTDRALRAENKKLKNMLRESAAPVRHFGTEGLSILKQMITATEKEMRGRSLIPNPCRPMKNPIRLAYSKTEPYDVILYQYEDGTWFFEIRDPGLGGTLVYDDHDGRSEQGAKKEALRVIKEEFEENPKKKPKKVSSLAAFKRLPEGTVVTVRGRTGHVVTHHRAGKGLYAAPTEWFEGNEKAGYDPLGSGARYFFDEDLEEYFRSGKENPEKKSKKSKKKKGMSAAGRGAVGAGIGALALGPIGAVGLGYAATKYKPVEENPGRPAAKFKVHVTGTYFSIETGSMPVRQTVTVEAITKDEARKKAASKMSDHADDMGYEFEGKHRRFKAERMNPKKKAKKKTTSPAKALISKCQKVWEHYCERPGRKRLKDVFTHLEKMEKSSAKSVKDELRRCKRSAKAEAKRLKMKV